MTTESIDHSNALESESERSDGSFEAPEALAIGREKRHTAGNRLRDMLNAEIESEAIFAEDEDDEDFGSDQEQQDDLNSELDSSSEEDAGAIEGEDAGERALKREEENAARLKKRKYRERLANPSIVKRAASHQVVKKSAEQSQTKKLKVQSTRPVSAKRQSARAHAVGIAAEVEKRLHEEATKKSKLVRVSKSEEIEMSQAERLAEAKTTEEQNVASLHQIVQYEEERKASRKLISSRRKAIGPLVRFVSTTKAADSAPHQGIPAMEQSVLNAEALEEPQGKSLVHPIDQLSKQPAVSSEILPSLVPRKCLTEANPKKHFLKTYLSFENFPNANVADNAEADALIFQSLLPLRRTGEGLVQIPYPDQPMCSFSGLPGKYCDPETRVRYGNLDAYSMLQEIKKGKVPWNPQLKLYVPPETESDLAASSGQTHVDSLQKEEEQGS